MLDALKVLFILTGASTYLVTKYIRIGIGDKNETLVYNMSAIDQANNSETKLIVNKNNQLSLTTMSSKEHEEFTRRRYGLSKQPTTSDILKNRSQATSTKDTFIKEYKYRVVSNENSSHTRFHFSDDQNIASQSRPTFEIEIMEEDDRYLPKRLLQVTVSDEKYQIKDVFYTVSGHGVDLKNLSRSLFGINSTSGEIYALRALDRDLPFGRPQWKLSVFAEEAKTRELVGYADVIVNLKDINDNAPFFAHKHYSANVTENGTIGQYIITLTAIDVDDPFDGSNARITYNIEDNQVNDNGELIFAIDSQTGVITTDVCCLDRESHAQYKIKVIASDGDGLKATTIVTIQVIDVNDMPPKFSKHEWFVEIDEMDTKNNSELSLIPQMPILIVTVTDSDLFESNNFFFKIVDNNKNSEYFSLTANSDASASLRVIKPLDYENVSQRNINLTIGVSDNGSNFSDTYHTDYCVIHVRLRDINDNEPQFVKSNIDISVAEDTKLGSIITKFHATDADQSGLSTVSYEILRESDKRRQFKIDSNGIVRLQRPLDRERQTKHRILVVATDDGNPPKSSTATLTITVDDVNDNAPNLLNSYLPVILENTPPQKVAEIFAYDLDDKTKGNGPPFTFRLDPMASDVIRDSFKVQHDHTKDGKAIVYSRTTFDREVEKEYLLPIVIKDSGFPAQTSTNTLTVIIGDINDNTMRDGWKKITLFYIKSTNEKIHSKGQRQQLTQIGRINVDDDDDWDLNDKSFYWFNQISDPNFELDPETGMISMRNISKGGYELKFTVFDRKHQQEVHSNVWIQVNEIEYEKVLNSGSVRITGITALQFISIWNWRTKQQIKSLYEKMKDSFRRLIRCDTIEIFSVVQREEIPPIVDVRYYATRKQSVLSSLFLNAVIEQNRAILENELQLNITQIGINECMDEENGECESSSCTTELLLNEPNLVLINSNYSAFVGINLITKANCICKYSQLLSEPLKSCADTKCLNGGTCVIASDKSLMCKCPEGVYGSHCELTTRSFNGQGWVWLEPLPQCSQSHISLEIITQIPNGLILYYGPMNRPSFGAKQIITDFISLELKNGMSRMLCDFGSGTQELIVNSPKPLNDGEWHTIDIFFDTQTVRLMVDHCVDAVIYDSEPLKMDRTRCENLTTSPFFSELLNVNAPLQVGGVSHQPIDKYYNWSHQHSRIGFTGCVRNLMHNDFLYDFGSVYNSANSLQGCSSGESMCSFFANMCQNGKCLGSYNKAECVCDPGWHGSRCEKLTQSKMFQQHSFIRYGLSFDINPYSNEIQLLFRTRESYGDLLRLSSKDKREYCILEIREARIQFRFNLNHLRSSTEQVLRLKNVFVNDGKWHLIQVKRFGSTASISLDGGGVGKYSRIDDYERLHQLIKVEKRNVVVGGDVNYIGIGAGVVGNDFDEGLSDLCVFLVTSCRSEFLVECDPYRGHVPKGTNICPAFAMTKEILIRCLNDIRIDGRHLPMENATENAYVLESQEVVDGCPSNNPCVRITCEVPLVCHDIWMMHECRCPAGSIESSDGKSCERIDECDNNNCMKDERSCMSSAAQLCSCSDNSTVCNQNADSLTISLNTIAVSAVIVCAINIPLIIAIIIIYMRYKRKLTNTNSDFDENRDQLEESVLKHDVDQRGDSNIERVSVSAKRVRVDPHSTVIDCYDKCNHEFDKSSLNAQHIGAEDLADIIRDHLEKIDIQIDDQCDNVCIYSLEESGDTVCSLSSLSSISSVQYNIVYTTAGSPYGVNYLNDN